MYSCLVTCTMSCLWCRVFPPSFSFIQNVVMPEFIHICCDVKQFYEPTENLNKNLNYCNSKKTQKKHTRKDNTRKAMTVDSLCKHSVTYPEGQHGVWGHQWYHSLGIHRGRNQNLRWSSEFGPVDKRVSKSSRVLFFNMKLGKLLEDKSKLYWFKEKADIWQTSATQEQ